MDIRIQVDPSILSIEELKEYLETMNSVNEGTFALEIRRVDSRVRAIETTVLIAIIGTLGTALGALIGGLLKVAQMASTKKIVIQGRDGTRIEVPADLDDDRIDAIIRRAKELDIQQIQLPRQ